MELKNVFGPELKSILKDKAEIDNIVHSIQRLVHPIQTVDFSLFMPDNKENWDVIINELYKEASVLEERCKQFIDNCFENLK